MKHVVQVLRKSSATSNKQLVMFPFGGGSGYSYVTLLPAIDPTAEIIVVNPPGHLLNEGDPLESVEAMAFLYARELRPLLKDNCLFFGHSIGGIVSYEICKDLEKHVKIKEMIISSVNPPHCIRDEVDLHSDMDTAALIDKCTVLGGLPQVFKAEPELLDMFIKGLRADLKALEKYRGASPHPGDRLKTTATVLYSDSDYIVDAKKIQEWRQYIDCRQFIEFSGDHFYLFDDANRQTVGKLLSDHLNQ